MPKFTTITPEAVAEIRELVAHRTEGDWRWSSGENQRSVLVVAGVPDTEFVLEGSDRGTIYHRDADGVFIAYAPEIIDSFLRYYEKTQKALTQLSLIAWEQHQAWMKALINLACEKGIRADEMYLVMDEQDRKNNFDFASFMTDHPELAGRRP